MDGRALALVSSWVWLEKHGKTPVDLGAPSWDHVDPLWSAAMMMISEAYDAQKRLNGGD